MPRISLKKIGEERSNKEFHQKLRLAWSQGEKTDVASTREAGKEQVEEAGASGVRSPPFKRQKTGTSEAEAIREEQLLEEEIPYGKLDKGKTGIKVIRDSTTSFDFSEVSQAIIAGSS